VKQSIAQIVAVVGLAILVVVSPWLFGAVKAPHQQWLFLVAALSFLPSGILIALVGPRSNRGRVPWTVIPLFGAAALGLAQLVPIAPTIHHAIDPHGFAWWQQGITAADATETARYTISLFPSSTLHDLALLGLAVAVFVQTSLVVTQRRWQLFLCGIAAVNGTAFALFGIVQQLTYNGQIYWQIPLRQGGNPFAAFVNRNHAGGYLNLCVAAALACLFWQLAPKYERGDVDEIVGAYALRGFWARWRLGLLVNLNSRAVWAISMGAITVAGVVCSLSRGAILALVAAALVACGAALRIRRSSASVFFAAIILAGGVGLALWLGRGDSLRGTIDETLDEFGSRGGNVRIDHWQDGMAVCRDFWLTGTGLGTYRYIYRPYETRLYPGWFYHAENQYLEAMVEGGTIGLVLVLGAILSVVMASLRLLKRSGAPAAFALGIAGLFAVTSQAVHSVFDFGLYMPANAILFGMLCGVVCAHVPPEDKSDDLWVVKPQWMSRVAHVAVLMLAFAWLCWGGWQIHKAAITENCVDRFWNLDDLQPRSSDETEFAIRQFEAALTSSPCDAETRFRLANLYILNYRAKATEEIVRNIDLMENQEKKLAIWQLTAPVFLHRRAHQLLVETPERFEELSRQRLVQQNLKPAVDNLLVASRCCPVMSKVQVALAELSVALPPGTDSRQFVQKAVRLAPNDPDILFRCGLLDIQSDRISNGLAKWRKSLALSPTYTEQILSIGPQFVDDDVLFDEAIPDSPVRIVEIAVKVQSTRLKVKLADRASVALEHSPLAGGEGMQIRAVISELKGDLPTAMRLFSEAVEMEPKNTVWRFQLARLLAENGLFREAQPHAEECVRQSPRSARYRQLLKRVNQSIRRQE